MRNKQGTYHEEEEEDYDDEIDPAERKNAPAGNYKEKLKGRHPGGRQEEEYSEEYDEEVGDEAVGDDDDQEDNGEQLEEEEDDEGVVEEYPGGITEYVPADPDRNCMVTV